MKRQKRIWAVSVLLCLSLTGCGLVETVNNERTTEYAPAEEAIVYSQNTGAVTGSRDEEKNLEGFDLLLENDYLKLYMGDYYDIAVYDKTTGHVTYSNEAYYSLDEETQKGLSEASKQLMYSQVALEYYNSAQNKMNMNSYPDAFSDSRNQVSVVTEGDTATVTYGLGSNLEESGLIQVFTGETFESYEAKLKELIDKKEASLIDYRTLINNYTAYKYENMSSADQKTYKERYPAIEELGSVYVVKSNLTTKIINEILAVYKLLGIDDTVKTSESEKLGEGGSSLKPAYFSIPVQYRLAGSDLLVSVDLQKVTVSEGYHLTKVELLKCFGATTADQDGYLLVPDGSGTIVENNIDSNSMDKLMIPFYGEDSARQLTEGTYLGIDNSFPVFGLKGDEFGTFGVVENGAAVGGMTAQAHGSYLNYNIAYPYFNYNVVDTFGIEGVAYQFYDVVPQVDYTVRYHFLSGDAATYSGMAAYYQQYLVQSGALTAREATAEDSLQLDIEFLGSVKKTVNDFGIPIEADYPLTTFEQAQEILSSLHEGGVEAVSVNYAGIVNGGMEQKALNKLKVESKLGGLKGFQALNQNITQTGDSLYMALEPAKIYERGYGITKTEDVSKYLTKSSAELGNYNPATGWMMERGVSWLINPLRYEGITQNLLKSLEKTQNSNLYLETVGSHLSGNYSAKEGVTRQTAQLLTEDMLSSLKDNGYKLKFDVGNDYILPYAESLVNVPTQSSHQRIESYSVPFVGMVLKGYIPFSCSSINQSANSGRALLAAIESGAGLNYLMIYDNQLNLQETNFETLFSVNYTTQLAEILENYDRLNAELGAQENVRIVLHEHLTEDVNRVTYEDGTQVYVNYGNEPYQSSDGAVEAMSWLTVRR